jgi:hypothetical protein
MCELTQGMAGEWHGNGMGAAWARHAICESAFRYPTPRQLSSNTGCVRKTNHDHSYATFPINEDVRHGEWQASPPTSLSACLGLQAQPAWIISLLTSVSTFITNTWQAQYTVSNSSFIFIRPFYVKNYVTEEALLNYPRIIHHQNNRPSLPVNAILQGWALLNKLRYNKDESPKILRSVSTHIRHSVKWTEGIYWPCSKALTTCTHALRQEVLKHFLSAV